MTLTELLKFPANEVEKFTTKQLEDFFAPYLNITRPERQSATVKKKAHHNNGATMIDTETEKKLALAKQRCKELGIDLPDILL